MHRPRSMAIRSGHGPAAADAAPGQPNPTWAVLIVVGLAQFMVTLDATVVNVALPSIGRSLHFAAADLQWVVTAYVLLSGGLMLLGGRASDAAGRRRVFLGGLTLFTVASLASGLAPTAGALIAARAGQGLGAALLTPAALSIVTTTYVGARRGTALSVWAAIGAGGAAVGVLAGGILTSWLGWRSVFLINVPAGLIVGALSLHLVPRSRPPAGLGRELDLRGALLVTAGLLTGVYAITGAPAHGWGSTRTLLPLAASLGLLAAFAVAEGSARRPLVPPRTWRSRSLVTGLVVMLGATGILIGTFFLNSLFLQDVQGASALRAGLEFLPLVAVIGLGAHATARLLPRAGSRALSVTGLVLMGGGALLLSAVSARSGYLTGLLPGLLLIGAGTGVVFPAASVTALSDAEEDRAGVASGLLTTAHDVGAALGVAVFSAVAAAQVAAGAGFAVGYRHGFIVAAAGAAGVAVIALLALPAVRPGPGVRVAVH
jgi:EmrB/QacA subfamily drug resistance transporter